MRRHVLLSVAIVIAIFPVSNASAQAWKPTRNVEIIVGSAAGGGADVTGRLMQKLLRDKQLVEASSGLRRAAGFASQVLIDLGIAK